VRSTRSHQRLASNKQQPRSSRRDFRDPICNFGDWSHPPAADTHSPAPDRHSLAPDRQKLPALNYLFPSLRQRLPKSWRWHALEIHLAVQRKRRRVNRISKVGLTSPASETSRGLRAAQASRFFEQKYKSVAGTPLVYIRAGELYIVACEVLLKSAPSLRARIAALSTGCYSSPLIF